MSISKLLARHAEVGSGFRFGSALMGLLVVSLIAGAGARAENHCQASSELTEEGGEWVLQGELAEGDDTSRDLGVERRSWHHTNYVDVYCFTISEFGDVSITMDSTSSLLGYVQVYSHDPAADDVRDEFLIQIDDAESGASGDVSLTVEFLPAGTYAITAGSRCDVDGNFNYCPAEAVGTYTVTAEFSAVNPLCTTRVPLGFGELAQGTLVEGDCSFTDLGDPSDTA
ncbi:MAG: hypothetical protein JRH19_27540, partial [Deltaproteobacteria bacterium]|nr:hypothetical protein [Deltaproteobacteria bacterium]